MKEPADIKFGLEEKMKKCTLDFRPYISCLKNALHPQERETSETYCKWFLKESCALDKYYKIYSDEEE